MKRSQIELEEAGSLILVFKLKLPNNKKATGRKPVLERGENSQRTVGVKLILLYQDINCLQQKRYFQLIFVQTSKSPAVQHKQKHQQWKKIYSHNNLYRIQVIVCLSEGKDQNCRCLKDNVAPQTLNQGEDLEASKEPAVGITQLQTDAVLIAQMNGNQKDMKMEDRMCLGVQDRITG